MLLCADNRLASEKTARLARTAIANGQARKKKKTSRNTIR